jgi:galactokinase
MNQVRRFRAPGRVNLIGGQVDYHEGLIVSMAIDRDIVVDLTPGAGTHIRATSREFDGEVVVAIDGRDDPRAITPPWGRTIGAVVQRLVELGYPPPPCDCAITSTVPVGAGLSSSAAISVACTMALADAAGFEIGADDLALFAQDVEHRATGVPCGIQDPMASVRGAAGRAVFLDCRSLSTELLPLPPELQVVVVHSGVPRMLEATPYAQRRAESIAVGERLGVRALRDATFEQVRDIPRGRHAVTEIRRVRAFADALRRGDIDALGPLMLESHASSRDDMEVSTPELNALVDALVGAGALGARLTGAGFGGCVVALAPADRAETIAAAAVDTYESCVSRTATAWLMQPSPGAAEI